MTLKHRDLENTILPKISIDQFLPKSGSEKNIIVVAFYLKDKDPAEDLNTFIQRGIVNVIDSDVSPATDEEGHYVVFVEMRRNNTFPGKFLALMRDIQNIVGKYKWRIHIQSHENREIYLSDKNLFKYIITDPEVYDRKINKKESNLKEKLNKFFYNTGVKHLEFDGKEITISSLGNKLKGEVLDIGDHDTVVLRNLLENSSFNVSNKSYEVRLLECILDNCDVTSLGKYTYISNDETVLLIDNLYVSY